MDPLQHDIRFVEDNWEAPTLGAWGLGWEIWLDGMEITQFTYFQQVGGLECHPVSAELTYGLERLAMYLQQVENVFDLESVFDIENVFAGTAKTCRSVRSKPARRYPLRRYLLELPCPARQPCAHAVRVPTRCV